jgi:hypothetical protein
MERPFEDYVAGRLQRQLAAGVKMKRQASSHSLQHEGGWMFQLRPTCCTAANLRKYKYPPEQPDAAVELVLGQAETLEEALDGVTPGPQCRAPKRPPACLAPDLCGQFGAPFLRPHCASRRRGRCGSYFHAARARARTCISGACGCAGGGQAAASGQLTCSNSHTMASLMKRLRPAYTCLSPPLCCCET